MSADDVTAVKQASLRHVAARAGVSLATASRVATGSANVRPVTRRRVEEAMRELLYVPPARERTGRTVGLLVPDLSNPIFPALAQAMETRATQAGFACQAPIPACSLLICQRERLWPG